MTSLQAISAHVPATRVPIRHIGRQLGLSDSEIKVYEHYYGLREVRYAAEGTYADLLLAAVGKLSALAGQEDRVRYVIHARTISTVAPYPVNPLREITEALGLEHALAFAVTQHACASGLLAVDIAGRLLAGDGDPQALALVLTGEKAFTPAARFIPATTFMGEGAAAILVQSGGTRDRLLSYAVKTDGRFADGLELSPELQAEFKAAYQHLLAETILAAVETAGLTMADLDLVLPHNVNRISWWRLAKHLGLSEKQIIMDNIPITGHCFCADPFINYQTASEAGRLLPGHRYLMAAVGLGATFSAMVFER
ncbi:3-oxoacyl-[acyl-carrier-protein] synthase III C-terminal domain-containing protein [Streptomyces sp. AA0539]|uniref:3-oxoacyl-[acyl-carrier-protein] synthase III C-terminal domain-containing protein n=1 Tax=Streptomyces sp. AA0539 TaxID=1210045 RepID=UPI0002E2A107|nr:3-oxoacyl-[acyl-carrier-protein] synthase III C-terminal domain-containing protein [Streptomyces sp. AA0539]